MTLESSLRRRAARARVFAACWLAASAIVLIFSFVYAPIAAEALINRISSVEIKGQASVKALGVVSNPSIQSRDEIKPVIEHPEIFTAVIILLSIGVACFASYLIARGAFHELALSAKWAGIADAMCVAGDNFEKFEKASAILVPKTKAFLGSDVFSSRDIKLFVDLIKSAKG